ncbi:hypothetical protein BKA82DRAFT_860273 [Pisolithus tinctorius]|uniref:Uncharacterized protein n=1 Tax=Pisolithus tinctorius Marx 270 TaxID=870435 RepID=A0A0C3NAA6_PISTI|nr:hypothetical protein BKA82DRAFT_860273 [Pisolithus tinctorius]KIN98044.1 hypothetical protein M404DRAFT_860273 [Pisolithus tinctorius Marx 270]
MYWHREQFSRNHPNITHRKKIIVIRLERFMCVQTTVSYNARNLSLLFLGVLSGVGGAYMHRGWGSRSPSRRCFHGV